MDRLPTIFLSSTFYDLRQVRRDLAEFIEDELGYRFLASEHPTFPVDAGLDTIENCRRRVEEDADILVLLIGSRYGSVPHGATHSVTNMEYASARAKGVPVYAFVHRDILAVLPVWKGNPEGNFAGIVDTPLLFDFIERVRSADRVWTFSFDVAQDIIEVLRAQFAFEMARGLAASRRIRGAQNELEGVSGEALRVAIDRPKGWQALFFSALLDQELRELSDAIRDYRLHIVHGSGERLSYSDLSEWMSANTGEADRLISQLSSVVLSAVNSATETSDLAAMRYGARSVGTTVRSALEWANRIRRAQMPDDLRPVMTALSEYMGASITTIQSLPEAVRNEVARLTGVPGNVEGQVKLTFDVDPEVKDRFNAAMRALRTKHRAP